MSNFDCEIKIKKSAREKIISDVDKFIRNGGVIKKCKQGEIAQNCEGYKNDKV